MSQELDTLILKQGIPNVALGFTTVLGGSIAGATVGLPQSIPASPLVGRKQIVLYNSSVTTCYLTHSAGASGSGIPFLTNTFLTVNAASGVYMVPFAVGQALSFLELG